jgi:CheY-like chemotaxis protein
MKILIAEDEPKTLLMLRLALEHRDHEVITTTNGDECINVYRNEFFACARQQRVSSDTNDKLSRPFDVVVLDYRMPTKNGIEVAEEILKLNPAERIVFASASTPAVLQALSIHSGDKRRVEWLQKPFELNLLADMLEDPANLREATSATLL